MNSYMYFVLKYEIKEKIHIYYYIKLLHISFKVTTILKT